jgi:hypothetical protein
MGETEYKNVRERGKPDWGDCGFINLPEEAYKWNYSKAVVAECAYDPESVTTWMIDGEIRSHKGSWVFQRLRKDKLDGNHLSVVKKVINSINENVSINDIKSIFNPTHDFPKHPFEEDLFICDSIANLEYYLSCTEGPKGCVKPDPPRERFEHHRGDRFNNHRA